MEQLRRLWADFTAMDSHNRVWVLPTTGVGLRSDAALGEVVELVDHEGNQCFAVVVGREGIGIVCELVLSTWRFTDSSFRVHTGTQPQEASLVVTPLELVA